MAEFWGILGDGLLSMASWLALSYVLIFSDTSIVVLESLREISEPSVF